MSVTRVFYSPREISIIVGVGKKCIYDLVQSGKLPHIRLNNRIRIHINDLKALKPEDLSVYSRRDVAARHARNRAETAEASVEQAVEQAGDVSVE